MDPFEDSYPNQSPYNYCLNNPVNLTDPTGSYVCGGGYSGPLWVDGNYDCPWAGRPRGIETERPVDPWFGFCSASFQKMSDDVVAWNRKNEDMQLQLAALENERLKLQAEFDAIMKGEQAKAQIIKDEAQKSKVNSDLFGIIYNEFSQVFSGNGILFLEYSFEGAAGPACGGAVNLNIDENGISVNGVLNYGISMFGLSESCGLSVGVFGGHKEELIGDGVDLNFNLSPGFSRLGGTLKESNGHYGFLINIPGIGVNAGWSISATSSIKTYTMLTLKWREVPGYTFRCIMKYIEEGPVLFTLPPK